MGIVDETCGRRHVESRGWRFVCMRVVGWAATAERDGYR